jgi:hypothetical protein
MFPDHCHDSIVTVVFGDREVHGTVHTTDRFASDTFDSGGNGARARARDAD